MDITGFYRLQEIISQEQFNGFVNKLKNEMTKIEYDCLILNTFLGNYLTPTVDLKQFSEISHELIDCISLSGPEIVFFHNLVDTNVTDSYINNLIQLYHQTTNLNKCQLGSTILKCLEASKKIKITT